MPSPKAKVFFATGSRADYGIVRRYLKLLDQDDEIELSILVTGALLDEQYGSQVSLIEEDGFFYWGTYSDSDRSHEQRKCLPFDGGCAGGIC